MEWLKLWVLITGIIAVALCIKLRFELNRNEFVKARVYLRYTRYLWSFAGLGIMFFGLAIYIMHGLILLRPEQIYAAAPLMIGALLVGAVFMYIGFMVIQTLR